MNYHLKGIKTWNGTDGGGFEATLYLDKKKIATVMNEGSGGCDHYRFFNREDEKPFETFAAEWYEKSDAKTEWVNLTKKHGGDEDPGMEYKMTSWIWDFIGSKELEKRLKRISKTKTLFRLKGDAKDEWRSLNALGDRAVQWLAKKYGEQLETIFGHPLPAVLGAATTAPSALNF